MHVNFKAIVMAAGVLAASVAPAFAQGYPGGFGQPQAPWAQQAPQAAPAPQAPRAPQAMQVDLEQLSQWERRDMGVQPPAGLHSGAFHGPTPNAIPGGQVVTTKGLVGLVQGGQMPYVILDVLGAPQALPGALPAAFAAQPGSFNDQTQGQLGQLLAKATNGNKEIPVILYCQGTECWMSYNAALRAIKLGYTNVLWYRGGLEAWQHAGLPTAAPGAGMPSFGGVPQPAPQPMPQPMPTPQAPQQPGGWAPAPAMPPSGPAAGGFPAAPQPTTGGWR